MISAVINEVRWFMVLFGIILTFFAECNHLLGVDVVPYGRTPRLIAHFMAMLRCSMGDFSPLDMWQTYDLIDNPDESSDTKYRHSYSILMVTWIIFLCSSFILFMVFMNFIIAVIDD